MLYICSTVYTKNTLDKGVLSNDSFKCPAVRSSINIMEIIFGKISECGTYIVPTNESTATCAILAWEIRIGQEWHIRRTLVSPNLYEFFKINRYLCPFNEHDTYINTKDFEAFKVSKDIKHLRMFENSRLAAAMAAVKDE